MVPRINLDFDDEVDKMWSFRSRCDILMEKYNEIYPDV
jgi:hypothetical protein